jgi:DNA-binding transcriptional LysR family regulator
MFDWNDLKYFLAVARHRSTIAAGKALGTSQSTVHRRLSELERTLGHPLVTRHSTGYRLTEFAEELQPYAERVEAAIEQLERHVADAARDRAGVIRLTCPEPIVSRLTPLIEQFHSLHPKLRVEFVISDRYLDLLKGEADVAIRSDVAFRSDAAFRSVATYDELVGRKIADSLWALYASREYIERHGKPECVKDLSLHPLVSLDESLNKVRVLQWLKDAVPDAKVSLCYSSVLGTVHAAKSGIGVAPLPTLMADNEKDLVRVLGPIPELARSWRLLTRPDIRRTPRISAFFDFIIAERVALKRILGESLDR